MRRGWIAFFTLAMLGPVWILPTAVAEDPSKIAGWAAKVKAVDRFGAGHREASEAVGQLSQLPPSDIPTVLAEMQGCTPLSANWFRAAIESSSQSDPSAIPVERLEGFLANTSNDPYARSLAFDLIISQRPDSQPVLVAGFLNDPCLELRYMAVEQLMGEVADLVEQERNEQALERYSSLLQAARNPDQINAIAKRLEELGQVIDLTKHYGFVTQWSLIGPFDNREKVGFDVGYPPEEEVNLSAELVGKEDATVAWNSHTTEADLGVVNLNEAVGKHMGAVAYATAEFVVDQETPAEIRIGTPNGNKVWVNGELVISNHVYHAGNAIDQFSGAVTLKPGANQILVKICQNEQTDSWAQDWQFQLRVTDETGQKIEASN